MNTENCFRLGDINLHFSMVTLAYTFLFERPRWTSTLRYTKHGFLMLKMFVLLEEYLKFEVKTEV